MKFFISSLCMIAALISGTSRAEVDPNEVGLVRFYFATMTAASLPGFECFDAEDIDRLGGELNRLKTGSDVSLNARKMMDDGHRYLSEFLTMLSCASVSNTVASFQLLDEDDLSEDATEFRTTLLQRELLLQMLDSAVLDASIMNLFNRGDADVLSGDVNHLFYELARDQIEFTLAVLTHRDIGLDLTSLSKAFLDYAESLDRTDNEDTLYRELSGNVSKIYNKMGLVLLDLQTSGDEANYLDAIVEYADATLPYTYAVNKRVLDSLPRGI